MHSAVVEIESKAPELVVKALEPEPAESPKFRAGLKAAKGKVVLTVSSNELSGLAAGLSSWLRLIRTANEASELK